ncbi:MAG TPA: hypothetical protein VGP17_10785 [Solirubrobacteraceae bacterium]|jgi:hypothetical protein|nr:hypothetical protein [Solirubrobacteraceae bacterium]
MRRLLALGRRAKIAVVGMAVMAVSMVSVAAAAATEEAKSSEVAKPILTKVETVWEANAPLIYAFIGLLIAIALVLFFARKHLKKA